jgi:hypothetical protein
MCSQLEAKRAEEEAMAMLAEATGTAELNATKVEDDDDDDDDEGESSNTAKPSAVTAKTVGDDDDDDDVLSVAVVELKPPAAAAFVDLDVDEFDSDELEDSEDAPVVVIKNIPPVAPPGAPAPAAAPPPPSAAPPPPSAAPPPPSAAPPIDASLIGDMDDDDDDDDDDQEDNDDDDDDEDEEDDDENDEVDEDGDTTKKSNERPSRPQGSGHMSAAADKMKTAKNVSQKYDAHKKSRDSKHKHSKHKVRESERMSNSAPMPALPQAPPRDSTAIRVAEDQLKAAPLPRKPTTSGTATAVAASPKAEEKRVRIDPSANERRRSMSVGEGSSPVAVDEKGAPMRNNSKWRNFQNQFLGDFLTERGDAAPLSSQLRTSSTAETEAVNTAAAAAVAPAAAATPAADAADDLKKPTNRAPAPPPGSAAAKVVSGSAGNKLGGSSKRRDRAPSSRKKTDDEPVEPAGEEAATGAPAATAAAAAAAAASAAAPPSATRVGGDNATIECLEALVSVLATRALGQSPLGETVSVRDSASSGAQASDGSGRNASDGVLRLRRDAARLEAALRRLDGATTHLLRAVSQHEELASSVLGTTKKQRGMEKRVSTTSKVAAEAASAAGSSSAAAAAGASSAATTSEQPTAMHWRWSRSVYAQPNAVAEHVDFAAWAESLSRRVHLQVLENDALVQDSMRAIDKQGWLTKKGQKRANWLRRWFVLQGYLLSYFDPKDGLKGSLDVRNCVCGMESEMTAHIKDKHENPFYVLIEGRKLFLSAETALERDSWISTIEMRKQRWQYVKKTQAVGHAPDPRLMHLLSGQSESHVDLSGAVASLEKMVSLDYYLRSPLAQHVMHLAIDDAGLGDLELQVISDALTLTTPRSPTLRTLSLCRNRLTADGAAHVARIWHAHGTALLALHLSGNERLCVGNGSVALAEIAHRIGPARCAIRRLALAGCGVDNKGAAALVRVFARQAAKADANVLASDQAVLEASGAVASGSAPTFYRLAALELADNLLDDGAVKDIGALCKKNANVEALLLSGNAITDTGAAQLLKALVGCSNVRLLDLARNQIKYGASVRQALAELHLSTTNTALRTIDLS